MVRLGIIGLGGMGNLHTQALASVRGCTVTAGVDVLRKARADYAEKHPDVALYADHKAMLKDGGVDAVLICTPTLSHKEIAVDALRSGRPVLTEKPMARTVADCRRMIDAADKANQVLMVAHCRRFDKNWGRFAQIVAQGKLGRPLLWRSVAAGTGPGAWFMDDREGGGPLLDGAVHNYDFANLMFGEPDTVVSSAISLTNRSAVDTASAVVRYKSGDQLMMSWAWGPRGEGAHDVMGPKGTLLFGPGDLKPAGDGNEYAYLRIWPNGKEQKLVRFRYSSMDMYIEEDRHFIACITAGKPCLAPGTESMKAVAVAEAVLKAGVKGGVRKVAW
ncbi:MAG: Gfo/Idh/MocA family oxidoreductase [Candidatus Hydrogenedentes bacterium]|nr:Gfo/Idh/MocA family oxidoreductase [Candidatus Hydrogenedentota bacterium]